MTLNRLPSKCKECGQRFSDDERAKGRRVHDHCIAAYADKRERSSIRKQTAAARKAARAERADTRERKEKLKRIPDLIADAQKEFNAYIRLRDAKQPCICCGRTADDKDLLTGSRWDAGHYRSTGSASHLRFHEDNCHRQLVRCNRHGAGRAVDYRIGLVRRIGLDRVEALEASNEPHKWQRDELIAIRDEYRAKRKELEKERE